MGCRSQELLRHNDGRHVFRTEMEIFDLSVHEDGDHAWVEFYWRFDAIMRQDRTLLHTEGRETQVLRRIGETWRIVHVHYSGMPVTGARQGF